MCKVYVETLLAQFEMGLSMLLLLMGPVTRNIHSAKVMHHHLHTLLLLQKNRVRKTQFLMMHCVSPKLRVKILTMISQLMHATMSTLNCIICDVTVVSISR